jgi:hypothetical protein
VPCEEAPGLLPDQVTWFASTRAYHGLARWYSNITPSSRRL